MTDEASLWVSCVCGEIYRGEDRWEQMWKHIDSFYEAGEPVHYAKTEGAITRHPEKK